MDFIRNYYAQISGLALLIVTFYKAWSEIDVTSIKRLSALQESISSDNHLLSTALSSAKEELIFRSLFGKNFKHSTNKLICSLYKSGEFTLNELKDAIPYFTEKNNQIFVNLELNKSDRVISVIFSTLLSTTLLPGACYLLFTPEHSLLKSLTGIIFLLIWGIYLRWLGQPIRSYYAAKRLKTKINSLTN